jgi:hypothetical protein
MGSGIAADHAGRSKIGESWTAAVTRCDAKTYRQALNRFSRPYSLSNVDREESSWKRWGWVSRCRALRSSEGRCRRRRMRRMRRDRSREEDRSSETGIRTEGKCSVGYNSARRLLLHCAALWPMADGRCWPASDLQIPVPPLRAPWLLIGFVVAGRWAVELRQLRWWQLLVHEGSLDDNGQGQAARRE